MSNKDKQIPRAGWLINVRPGWKLPVQWISFLPKPLKPLCLDRHAPVSFYVAVLHTARSGRCLQWPVEDSKLQAAEHRLGGL